MKRIISLVIVAVMLLSLFSVGAFAAERPSETAGPATEPGMYGGARIGLYNPATNKNTYAVNYNYREGKLEVYKDAISGMTYDILTNTCTVTDLKQPEKELFVWYMGNDFKLKIEGECEFRSIYVCNPFNFHGTSLNIIGDGVLTVNKNTLVDSAIEMLCDGDNGVLSLDIADTVTVHLYSKEYEEIPEDGEKYAPVVALSQTAVTPADGGAITVGGKAAPGVKYQQLTEEIPETVSAIIVTDRNQDFPHGAKLKSKSDPNGVYALGDIMDDVTYVVNRYMYVSALNMWVVDHSFATDSWMNGRRYNKEQFEAEYNYVYGMAPTPIKYMESYKMDMRGNEGVKITKDGEPDAVYIGLPTGGVWDWGDDVDYKGNYEISRVLWDDKQQIYVVDTSFEAIDLMAAELEENGYHVETETVDEPLELSVWTTEDPSDMSRFELTNSVLKRSSDPDGLYIQTGTYAGSGDDSGIVVHKVHYNPETEEHYILYDSYSSSEFFTVSSAAIESGEADFSYAVETKTKYVYLRYLSEEYNINWDLVNGTQLTKNDDPDGVYAYKQWTHYSQGIEQEKYAIIKLNYYDDLGCYVQDSDFGEQEFYDLGSLENLGYKIHKSSQPIDYVTKGNIELGEYPVYTDKGGSKYYVDYEDNVYSFMEEDIIQLGEEKYYYGMPMPNKSVDDLNDTVHTVLTDNYSYLLSGPEYHHVGAEQPEPQAYALWVNGEQVTSDHLTISCGKGTATFNPSNHTLTLNNAEITKGTDTDWTYTGILSHLPAISVVVMGDCTITETGGDGIGTYNSESYQIGDVIYPAPYDMTVCGDGTLTIKESTPMYGYGLYCTGNLTIDGITLKIDSAAAGIWASDLKMSDTKADIHTSSWYSGIVVNRGDFDFDNCTVTAESAEGSGLLLGSDTDFSTLTVNSGTLTLKGKIGVQGEVDKSIVTVNGGKLAIDSTNGAFDETFLADNAKNIVMGEGIGVTSGEINGKAVVIEKLSASGGFTLSGKLTTFLGDKDYVYIRLLSEENWEINSLFDGDATEYEIGNVPAGTYTMTVSKKNHVTRTYQLTVSGDTTQDAKLHPIGDINGDGKVTTMDFGRANAHARGTAALTGYEFDCANVIPDAGTAKVTTMDAGRINAHAKGTSSLWAA